MLSSRSSVRVGVSLERPKMVEQERKPQRGRMTNGNGSGNQAVEGVEESKRSEQCAFHFIAALAGPPSS
jgi:hypothetical protein